MDPIIRELYRALAKAGWKIVEIRTILCWEHSSYGIMEVGGSKIGRFVKKYAKGYLIDE